MFLEFTQQFVKYKPSYSKTTSHKEEKVWYHLAYRQPSTKTRYCKQESTKSKTRACRVRLCLSYRNAGAPGHGRVGRDPGAATEAPPELRATQHLSIPSQHLTTLITHLSSKYPSSTLLLKDA